VSKNEIQELSAHDHANVFPMATEEELAEMAEDIKNRGLLNPIIMLDGKILDGRNRFKACQMAGVKPKFKEYDGEDSLADVVSWNLKRRHLTPSQQAGIGAEVANVRHGGDRRSDQAADLPLEKVSQAESAKMVGVSERMVRDAVKVKKADPELHEKVKSGEITVNAAREEVKRRAEEKDGGKSAWKSRSVGLEQAKVACAALQKIPPDDPFRARAWEFVRAWLDENY
jgi:ParB-like chromosome segregation protein Spo0J